MSNKKKEDTIDAMCHDNTRHTRDKLCMLYAKAAKRQDMIFQDYCRHVHNFNTDHCHMVMCNTAWCKSYINVQRHGEIKKGYSIFLSHPWGTGKSHVVHLIQRDMSHFFKHTVKYDDDQPTVLITVPIGSAAFQIGGSTIHSTFLLHDNYKTKPSWEKRSKMQLKLEHMMLSITDEIIMVGFKQFQSMNQTMYALNVVIDETTGKMSTILVAFDSKHVGQEAMHTSVYHSINQNTVPIHQTQATFPIQKKASFQATRSQFPLTLAWAVTMHKCQGLTLPEIFIDMTPAKSKFKPGEAYVVFSRVRSLEKLQIINYI